MKKWINNLSFALWTTAALATVAAGSVCAKTGLAPALVTHRAKAVMLIRRFMGVIVRNGRDTDDDTAASSRIRYYYFYSLKGNKRLGWKPI